MLSTLKQFFCGLVLSVTHVRSDHYRGRDQLEYSLCGDCRAGLGQVHVFENLIENLPARAARKNFQRFACLRAVSEKIYECVRSAHTSHVLNLVHTRLDTHSSISANSVYMSVHSSLYMGGSFLCVHSLSWHSR